MSPGRNSRAEDPIVVSGAGLSTPVGRDVRSTGAAIRAGIGRFRMIPSFLTSDGATAAGAIAYGLTDDLSGSGRLLAMAIPAAREALFQAEEFFDPLDLSRGRLLLCLPPEQRPRFEDFGRDDLANLLQEIEADPLLDGRVQLILDGHAGGFSAFQSAQQLLTEGGVDFCLVGGVDSLVDPPVLNWLHEAGRLKTEHHPDGFLPGEAAAFLVLERDSSARARGAPILAGLAAAAFAQDPAHLFSGSPQTGSGLTTVLRQVLTDASPSVDGILCDLNGEYWRSKEWSLAASRTLNETTEAPVWFPAQSIGDVGAASAPVLAAIAVTTIRSDYFGGRKVLVCSSSDAGGRGSAILTDAPPRVSPA